MQGKQLDDRAAGRWCAWACENVPAFIHKSDIQRRSDGFLVAREVNFSTNSLGDHGVHQVLKMLYKLRIGVRILKLFKNCLGRAAASALMDWLVVTPVAVFELHLSHNFITREGAVDILKAVAYNPAYPPEKPGRGRVPLWLRLEKNVVENPDHLIECAEKQMKKIRELLPPPDRPGGGSTSSSGPMLCYVKNTALNSGTSTGCRSDYCEQSRPDGHCPLAQVTYLAHQRDGPVRLPTESQGWQNARDAREEAARWRICAEQSRPALKRMPSGGRPAPEKKPAGSVPTAWSAGPPVVADS
jgi:hypothetical protein